jgi:hypothetical protein
MIKIFLDTEFTGLHKETTLISIGLIAESGQTFYAELTNYDKYQISPWIQENVIKNLTLLEESYGYKCYSNESMICKGDTDFVKQELTGWLSQFDSIKIYADVLAYDWVLFCNIFDSALDIPKNIHYIPRDISTILECMGIDPDIDRSLLVGNNKLNRHNAMDDAMLTKLVYENIII